MLSGKLSLLVLSFLASAQASLLSSSSSSKSGSTSTSNRSSSRSRNSNSNSDGYNYYARSKDSSSRGSSDSDRRSYSSDSDIDVVTRCKRKGDVHIVVNQPFSKKFARIADYFHRKHIKASFIINGHDLVNTLNYKSETHAEMVRVASENGRTIIVKPHNLKAVKDLNPLELLNAVQLSAAGIQTVLGVHPIMVHIPKGLSHDSRGKQQASLLKDYGYTVVHFSKSVDKRGKNFRDLRGKSRKNRKSRKSRKSTRKSSSKRWRNMISSTSSSRSSSHSSSSSGSTEEYRRRRNRHRRHREARGHIVYGRKGKGLGRNVQRTVERLDHRGYKFVDFKTCSNLRPYREVINNQASDAFLVA